LGVSQFDDTVLGKKKSIKLCVLGLKRPVFANYWKKPGKRTRKDGKHPFFVFF
jgi:hypothetical protein